MSIKLIEYIAVLGFHHQLGHRIEFLYPDLNNNEEDKNKFNWNLLPFYGIGDGAHNSFEDFSYFIMDEINATTNPSRKLYGLSCFKQKNKKDLPKSAITSEDTRSSIQKSVVILSKFPIFNTFKTQLASATICYFNQGDFQNTDILVTWYNAQNNDFKERNSERLESTLHYNNKINQYFNSFTNNNSNSNSSSSILDDEEDIFSLNSNSINNSSSNSINKSNNIDKLPINSDFLFGSMSLKKFIMHFGRNSLVLFKLLMLERGVVVFCPQPISPVCESIMSLISLFPKSYDLLLSQNSSVSNVFEIDWTSSTSEEMVLNQLALPLEIFGNNNNVFLQPYLPLQQMNALLPNNNSNNNNSSYRGYIVGTSNNLFLKSPPSTTHAIVDIQSGEIHFRDQTLNKALELTSSDRRFIDNVFDKVELLYNQNQHNNSNNTTNKNNNSNNNNSSSKNNNDDNNHFKEGSDKWIRDQFENYIVCLLSSICRFTKQEDGNTVLTNMDKLSQYNDNWIKKWTYTKNFNLWRKSVSKGGGLPQLNTYPVHPSGPPSDMLDKFQDKITASMKDLQPLTTQFSKYFSITSSLLFNGTINNNKNSSNNNNYDEFNNNNNQNQNQNQNNTFILKSSNSEEYLYNSENSSGSGIFNGSHVNWSKVQEKSIYAANKAVTNSKEIAKQLSNSLMNYIAPLPEDVNLNNNNYSNDLDESNNDLFEAPPTDYDFIGNYYNDNSNINSISSSNGMVRNNSSSNMVRNNSSNNMVRNNSSGNMIRNNSSGNINIPTFQQQPPITTTSKKIVNIISTSYDDSDDYLEQRATTTTTTTTSKKSYELASDTQSLDDVYEL